MRKLIVASLFVLGLGLSSTAQALPAYLKELCQDPKYTCIKVHKGETWESIFADAELRNIIKHFNRVNIQPKPGQYIIVPNDMVNIKLLDLSPFAKTIPASGQETVIFDPALHAWGAYNAQGQLLKWGPASGGRDWCSDINSRCNTVVGEFTVLRKQGAKCASSQFPLPNGGAPMPYCMHFHRGYAIHASTDVPGYNASHGCVRVTLEDARWLNQEFAKLAHEGGTKVIIKPYPAKDKP